MSQPHGLLPEDEVPGVLVEDETGGRDGAREVVLLLTELTRFST